MKNIVRIQWIRLTAAIIVTVALLIGPSGAGPLGPLGPATALASGTFLPRDRAIWTAEDYRSFEWYTSGNGLQVGVRYEWGGFQSVAQFQSALGDDSSSGDGVDCSGFVSRVWEQPQKYGTSTLPQISHWISDGDRRRADIYNDITTHTMLYFQENGPSYRRVYEALGSAGKVILNSRPHSDFSGYTPYRYNNMTDDPQNSRYDNMHTYLPYVKVNNNTNTWIRIRDMSSGSSGTVTFYNSNGSVAASTNFSVGQWGTLPISASSYVGTGLYAVQVSSTNAVAVSAEINSTPSGFETDAYAGMTNGSDKIFLPLVMYNWGTANKYTDFDIMNLGDSAKSFYVEYFKMGGNGNTPSRQSFTIQPGGFQNIDVRTQSGWSGNTYATAVIYSTDTASSGQIVVTARQRRDADNSSVLFNGLNSEDARRATRVPLFMNNNNYWNSGLQVQNTGNRSTTVTVNYYYPDGAWVKSSSATIAPNNAATFYAPNEGLPSGFYGSATVDTNGSNHQSIVAITNHENNANTRSVAHEGGNIGAWMSYAPVVLNRSDYVSGIQVQNVDGSQAEVYVTYYDQYGNYQSQVGPFYLNPGVAHNIYPAGPSNFDGSARVWSNNNKRLVTITNLTALGQTGDVDKGYTLPIPRVEEINP